MQEFQTLYDIAVIGGGINGVGIANDAAGRGLKVFLCEKDDLASHTSSASSKLIHGGLRYLEQKEFRLVREALAEREVLLAKAPHLIRPMRFILPHQPNLRPAWLIRTGLFFYDHLGKRKQLPGSKAVRFDPMDSPFKDEITRGFEYSDCTVDDARLVVLNAVQAREMGAKIVMRTRCLAAKRQKGLWLLDLENEHGSYQIQAKALVNATGPWVAEWIQQALQLKSPYGIRWIQGSHIIVKKMYEEDKAFILQHDDQRIVFVIPYLNQYSLIGTTDREYVGDPNQVKITQQEEDYLLKVCNDHFKVQLTQADIISRFSGVRALCDDESDNPSAITRDYTLAISPVNEGAPLLSVFGGKLTTYRKLAESAMSHLQPFFSTMQKSWTEQALLPGAEQLDGLAALSMQVMQQVDGVSQKLAQRWVHAYGSRVWKWLNHASAYHELGRDFGHGLSAREVDYLVDQEWAVSSQDILWRRTKLGLEFTETEISVLDAYLVELHQRRAQERAA